MLEIISEKSINDDISVLVLKRPGEAPYTQIVASKLSLIRKLQKYIVKNHGNKREYYQQKMDNLLLQYEKEQNN